MRVRDGRSRSRALVIFVATMGTLIALGGIGLIAYYITQTKGGALTPEDAARGFAEALLGGESKKAISFVHPRMQSDAKDSLQNLEKTNTPLEKAVGQIVPTTTGGEIEVAVGKQNPQPEGLLKVELVFRSGGLPMRRSWVLLSKKGKRWFIAMNPFVLPEE